MVVADLNRMDGRRFPAGRQSKNVVGGASPIQAQNFCLGYVTLDAHGGQVPWHSHEQEEVYFLIEGIAEMCLGEEKGLMSTGQAVYIPSGIFHQLTNIGSTPARFVYCFGPAGIVAHWQQELVGTLPRAGIEAPDLPEGAHAQILFTPETES